MRVRVLHDIDDLASDLAAIPSQFSRKAPKIVAKNARAGNKIAQRLSRQRGGPHGKSFFKRLSAEAIGPLSWEYGPEGTPKTEFVGVGYRNGGPNLDLPDSADLIRVKFGDDVAELVDGLFW